MLGGGVGSRGSRLKNGGVGAERSGIQGHFKRSTCQPGQSEFPEYRGGGGGEEELKLGSFDTRTLPTTKLEISCACPGAIQSPHPNVWYLGKTTRNPGSSPKAQ